MDPKEGLFSHKRRARSFLSRAFFSLLARTCLFKELALILVLCHRPATGCQEGAAHRASDATSEAFMVRMTSTSSRSFCTMLSRSCFCEYRLSFSISNCSHEGIVSSLRH